VQKAAPLLPGSWCPPVYRVFQKFLHTFHFGAERWSEIIER
jgi:hypothetical protein